jgi:WD40-like Beta Propeller Repeat
MRRLAALPLLCAVTLLALCASAHADVFGPIALVSDDALEQADYAHDPAISGNGEYVAFDGYFGGLTGIWRRDLASPSSPVEAVAVGEPGTPAGSAELPSISENGQYISFTTTAALSPTNDTNTAPDVYVRNMSVAESQPCEEEESINPIQPCAFTLASAVNGSTHGLSYEYSSGSSREFEESHDGAMASGRAAMSANGQEVVFVTVAPSNLAGVETPQLQVAVRHLQSGKTELVSVESDPATGRPVPGPDAVRVQEGVGAVYSIGAFESPQPYSLTRQVPASISADGSTVAWLGQDIGEQAQTLSAEALAPKYTEPLWRRIANGEEAPTRRVTGGSDPANPACVSSGETALPEKRSLSDPCQGPFVTTGSHGSWTEATGVESPVPRLSADGYTVAFIAQAPLVAFGSDFDVEAENRHGDLYVVDMHEGLGRVQALTPLTELASGNEGVLATNAPIVDFGVSPDGSQVAFTTMRTQFILGSPAYVNAPAAVAGMLELFDVDLADDTLTRVTHGYGGGPSEAPHEEATSKEDQYVEVGMGDGALSPSFSDSGERLAFSSTASNLVYGDGNTPPLSRTGSVESDGSDVFIIRRETFPSDPAPQIISGPPAPPSPIVPWSLGVTAASLADGGVRLYIEAPAAGTLRAAASSRVAVRSELPSHAARGAHKAKSARASTTVLNREVAAATHVSDASVSGLTTLTLTLSRNYRSLATRRGGLSATVSVTFTAPGHPVLHRSIVVSFLRKAPAHAVASAHHTAAGHRSR